MAALAPTQSSDCTNPALDIHLSVTGNPTDVFILEYQIFEKVTTPATPIQVFPGSGRATVDLTDCPTGDRLSTGRYVALWTVPAGELIGTHCIKWFFKLAASSPEQMFSEEFEIVATVATPTGVNYCSVADLRAEGVPDSITDAFLLKRIADATDYITRVTRRIFVPVAKTVRLDGNGSTEVLFDEPVIDVTAAGLYPYPSDGLFNIPLGDILVYNRHITQNLLIPDDRLNPKIQYYIADEDQKRLGSILNGAIFPQGVQNIQITGTFGYTEYDGTSTGKTPGLIQQAACKLVLRNIDPLWPDAAGLRTVSGPITREKTREQEVEYVRDLRGLPTKGAFTGDSEIDSILAMFKKTGLIRTTRKRPIRRSV